MRYNAQAVSVFRRGSHAFDGEPSPCQCAAIDRRPTVTVKRNIVANFIGSGIASGLSLALVPVYIHYLTIEAYALVGLFGVIQVWLTLLDLGMTPTLNREMARFTAGAIPATAIKDLLRTLEIVVFGLALAIAIVLTTASGFLANHWLRVEHLPVTAVARGLSLIGVVVGLRFCEGIYRSAIIGLQQQVWLNGAGVALAVLRGLGAVAVLTVTPTIEAFFVWQAFVSVVTLAVLGSKLHFALPKTAAQSRFSVSALRDIRGFAGGMMGMTLLAVLLTQVDKLLLSRLLPLAQFGYYMLGSAVSAAVYLAIGPVTQAIYPNFVRLYVAEDWPRLATAYHQASQIVTVLLAPTTLMLVVFPRAILFAWSGDAVLADHSAPILAMLATGTFLNALMQVPHQLQLASGWTSLAVKMNVVAVIVLVPALLFAVPLYGAVAAAGIWALLNTGYIVVGIPLLHRRLLPGEMRGWVVADVLLPALGASAVIAAAAIVAPGQTASRLVLLVFLVAAGAASTIGAAVLSNIIRRRTVLALEVMVVRRRTVRRLASRR